MGMAPVSLEVAAASGFSASLVGDGGGVAVVGDVPPTADFFRSSFDAVALTLNFRSDDDVTFRLAFVPDSWMAFNGTASSISFSSIRDL